LLTRDTRKKVACCDACSWRKIKRRGAGLIANLARPGGNFTGLQNYEASITGK
jgi:hypothetical protein